MKASNQPGTWLTTMSTPVPQRFPISPSAGASFRRSRLAWELRVLVGSGWNPQIAFRSSAFEKTR